MSKIRFEHINGQLCRMVEPEPLMPDSQYPCAVKLVGGNDTPLGRYNNSTVCCSRDFDPIVACGTGSLKFHYSRYEIIGHPVADGSAEWALWQRQNKRSVITDTGVVMRYHYDDETCNALLRVYPTGWQLYTEPEPQPAKEPIANCDNCKHICTNSNIDYCHMYEPRPAYAVGDWVQCGIMQAEIRELREILNGRQIYHMKEADGTEYDADSSAFDRKLSSSEVRVKITLEGTVRKSQLAGCFVLDTPLPGNDVHTIRFADIDPATASMVKELLEKQGEAK